MLVIRIELWSAITGQRREIGTVTIANVGGTKTRGNYEVKLFKNLRDAAKKAIWKKGVVEGFPRLRLGPYDLLLRALAAMVGGRNPEALATAMEHYDREDDAAQGDLLSGTSGCLCGGEPGPTRDT